MKLLDSLIHSSPWCVFRLPVFRHQEWMWLAQVLDLLRWFQREVSGFLVNETCWKAGKDILSPAMRKQLCPHKNRAMGFLSPNASSIWVSMHLLMWHDCSFDVTWFDLMTSWFVSSWDIQCVFQRVWTLYAPFFHDNTFVVLYSEPIIEEICIGGTMRDPIFHLNGCWKTDHNLCKISCLLNLRLLVPKS